MTVKEAMKIFRKEDQSIRILRDSETEDIYIVKPDLGMTPPTILAWVCGQESGHFISYEGLDKKESYMALSDLAETLPKDRDDGEYHDNVGK